MGHLAEKMRENLVFLQSPFFGGLICEKNKASHCLLCFGELLGPFEPVLYTICTVYM